VVLYFVEVRGVEIWLGDFGSGAVILRCHHPAVSSPSSSSPAYLLAELATTPHRRFPNPDAVLLLWRSDEQEQPTLPQWVRKEVHLPR